MKREGKRKNIFTRKRVLIGLVVVLLIGFVLLYWRTGIFQADKINERDLGVWERDADGIVLGAKEFVIEGNKETCWLLIHGFTSTPNEMIPLSQRISLEFGDYVEAVRLKGHGELPSEVINLTLDDWYVQVEEKFDELDLECGKVNLVGFSFGGALSTRLAEEKQANNVYLLAPYIYARYKAIKVFRLEIYLKSFANIIQYSKKTKIAQVNDPEGEASYISYWNFPVVPVLDSQQFLKELVLNLENIKEAVLIQHSENDDTADLDSSELIFEKISSEDKELIILNKSNHVLLADYDKEEVINNIIEFEKERR